MTAREGEPRWRKSSACLPRECVEVATRKGHILIRDSVDATGPVLEFEKDQWRKFVGEISSARKQ
jgi:Domain of unknown function (DUF397)